MDCVTYKKWKPLGRVGMIVISELGGKSLSSSYRLTRESEDGTISLNNDKRINSILKKGNGYLNTIHILLLFLLKNIVGLFYVRLE